MIGLPSLTAESPELVVRTREGDERAFAMLIARYRPIVFRWAIGLSGDEDDADDVTQEVFVLALSHHAPRCPSNASERFIRRAQRRS